MLSNYCKSCKYVIWMVGIGQGIRCNHPENQKYKQNKEDYKGPVTISYVPNCKFYVEKNNK